MQFIFIILFLMFNTAWAEVGKITKVLGDQDSYIIRDSESIKVTPETLIELNDEIFSQGSYLVIHLYPGTQMSLAKNSQVRITENMIEEAGDLEKTTSVIDFIKGIIRVQVTKDTNQEINQKIQAKDVAFGVRGTEFEISLEENQDVDLDVFEGEVEVTSPEVHTFVPEIVKANEGFRFERRKKAFSKRRFAPKFRNHPGFAERKEIKRKWKEMKQRRKAQKATVRADRKADKVRQKNLRKNQRRANKGSR